MTEISIDILAQRDIKYFREKYLLIVDGKVYEATVSDGAGVMTIGSPQLLEFVDPVNVRGSNSGTAIFQGYDRVYKVKGPAGMTAEQLLEQVLHVLYEG